MLDDCVFSAVNGDSVVNHEKVKDLQYLCWIQIYLGSSLIYKIYHIVSRWQVRM